MLLQGTIRSPGSQARNTFVATWCTTNLSPNSSGANEIRLPVVPCGLYNFTVDWGDGSHDHIQRWNDPHVTHTYCDPGEYEIRISGKFSGFSFNNNGDKLKILNVKKWGCLDLGIVSDHFEGCTNFVSTADDVLNLNDTTSFVNSFNGCTSFNGDPGIQRWNTSKIQDMSVMFKRCISFDRNLGSWNISALTNAHRMFQHVTLSTSNYDALLLGWEDQLRNESVVFDGGDSKFNLRSEAGKARRRLINFDNWSISDGGPK